MSLPDSRSPDAQRGVYVEKARANIYTVLLAISLVAIIIGCICLGAEISMYGGDIFAKSASGL